MKVSKDFKGLKLNTLGEYVMLVEYFGDSKDINGHKLKPKVLFKFTRDEAKNLGII
jgi:hypothetical protein